MGVGLDFGTTNSSLAVTDATGAVRLVRFPHRTGETESYRSLLYLEKVREHARSVIKSWSGPAGIEQYLQSDEKGRLMQSLKSFLASRSLQTTEVLGRRFQLEDLIARILRDLRGGYEAQFGALPERIVVGRPVRFAGSESEEDDNYAIGRLQAALQQAGFKGVQFEYEPIGAAYHYESTLDHDELVLIGDFGGGTTDFSLLQLGPSFRRGKRAILGTEGLGIAGDSFDAKIVRHLVSPALGAGTMLRSGDKLLPVPNWVYFKLERWHHLSFLKASETLNMLRSVAVQAQDPAAIRALIYLVEHDLGYHLHRAVQRVKLTLSQTHRTTFRFSDGDAQLEGDVTRDEFELWISEELQEISEMMESLLQKTGTAAAKVDRVFLTGGSSLVPAVRRIFEDKFGAEKLRGGSEFTSVAQGLALLQTNG